MCIYLMKGELLSVTPIRSVIVQSLWNQMIIRDERHCQKREFLKSAKKLDSFKWVSLWLMTKNETFFSFMFLIKSSQKRYFRDILDRKKKAFKTRKEKFEKVPKNHQFPKRLAHSFCPIIELFLICVFWANQVRKDLFLWYSGFRKECFLDQKKRSFKKCHKIDIFQRG